MFRIHLLRLFKSIVLLMLARKSMIGAQVPYVVYRFQKLRTLVMLAIKDVLSLEDETSDKYDIELGDSALNSILH